MSSILKCYNSSEQDAVRLQTCTIAATIKSKDRETFTKAAHSKTKFRVLFPSHNSARGKFPCKLLHLLFLKWTFGIHKRTNNRAVIVHYPFVIKQSIKYFERLQGLNDSGKLVEMHSLNNRS